MIIERAALRDAQEVVLLVRECVRDMNAKGIYQWNEDYPLPEMLFSDIEKGNLFATRENEKILGIFVLDEVQDEVYEKIPWKDEHGRPLVIHRLAVHPAWRRKGIALKLIEFACESARRKGCTSIRIDTHSGNHESRRLLERSGFDRRPGEIFFPECDGPFYCFELILDEYGRERKVHKRDAYKRD